LHDITKNLNSEKIVRHNVSTETASDEDLWSLEIGTMIYIKVDGINVSECIINLSLLYNASGHLLSRNLNHYNRRWIRLYIL
jgi:hypothetical protein